MSRKAADPARPMDPGTAGGALQNNTESISFQVTVLTWLVVIPVAAVYLFIAVMWLPSLIGADAGRGDLTFFSDVPLAPEPLEQARYLLALTVPVALFGLSVAAGGGRLQAWFVRRRKALVYFAVPVQVALVLFVGFCWWRQSVVHPYFRPWQLAVASGAGALATLALYRRGRTWHARRGRRGRSVAAAAAIVATIAGLSFAFFRESNVAFALPGVYGNFPYPFEEFAAITEGRTGLVDFTPQYTVLLPYLAAPAFKTFGLSVEAYTGLMCLLSAVALLAVYLTLNRLTGRVGPALGLYFGFLLLTLYPAERMGPQVLNASNYYPALPLRYLGPLVLVFLVGRYLNAPTPRRLLLAFFVAGLGLVNNVDFGFAALAGAGAALVADVAGIRAFSFRRMLRSLGLAAFGTLAAIALFALFILARSGSLPNLGRLIDFARQFALGGYFMLPMPAVGLHSIMYLTFVASLIIAGIRAFLGHRPGPASGRIGTGLLAYSGVFGLGALTYYVGRSHALVLVTIFCAWALCLSVLTWEAVNHLAALRTAPPLARVIWFLPIFLVFAHAALPVTALPDQSALLAQPQRIASSGFPRIFEANAMRGLIDDCARHDEDVVMFYPLGYRLARESGLTNFFPYNGPESLVTTAQLKELLNVLRGQQISTIFSGEMRPEIAAALRAEGFQEVVVRTDPAFNANFFFTRGPRLAYWNRTGAPPSASCVAEAA